MELAKRIAAGRPFSATGHSLGGGHIGLVVDLPAISSAGAHWKNSRWQAVLATDWALVEPSGR